MSATITTAPTALSRLAGTRVLVLNWRDVRHPQAERCVPAVDPGELFRRVVEVPHLPGRSEGQQVVAEED